MRIQPLCAFHNDVGLGNLATHANFTKETLDHPKENEKKHVGTERTRPEN